MEENNLNKRIIENVRNRVVISNMESEEIMKLGKRKHILSVIAVAIVMMGGSFLTVNAATEGELVEKVKDKIQIIFVDLNGKREEIEGVTYVEHNNDILNNYEVEKYVIEKDGVKYEFEVDEKNLENTDANLKIDVNEINEDINLTIKYDYIKE